MAVQAIQTGPISIAGIILPAAVTIGDAFSLHVFEKRHLIGTATNASSREATNPWLEFDITVPVTHQVAIENLSGPNPGLIKEIAASDGVPITISGANTGPIFGHEMTPEATTAGAVNVADTPGARTTNVAAMARAISTPVAPPPTATNFNR
jgi:hypothetical protein